MRNYTVYRLTFKTQLHLGRAAEPVQQSRLGLEKTDIYIRADILFSAICQTWATFYDTESLTDFLEPYRQDAPVLPLLLTSAFPYAHNVYFYPKPLTLRESQDTPEKVKAKAKKKIKKVQFVSGPLFQQILSGHLPEFSEAKPMAITLNGEKVYPMNSEKVWLGAEENKHLKAELPPNNESENEEINIWTTKILPRVTIGGQNAGSEIWHIETLGFNTSCGLWFAAAFDTPETQQKFETLLRVLGDTGIGGERNAGYGMFDVESVKLQLPIVETGGRFVTLSPICPKSSEQLETLREGDIAYNLQSVPGWGSKNTNNLHRKNVYLFLEGSVLHSCEARVGRLIDLKLDTSTHPVYRYGYAWHVGIKEASQ